MEINIFTLIRSRYNTLSKVQKNIANYILDNKSDAIRITISEIAQRCEVTEPTVIRFINKLGYSSYQTFRIDMAEEYAKRDFNTITEGVKIEDGYQSILETDDVSVVKKKVIASSSCAITDLENLLVDSDIEEAVRLFIESNTILFYGSGGSSVIALDAYHKFMRLGRNVHFDANSHFALIKSGHLTENDLIVLVSHTGESREVIECAENAKRYNCKVIGVTSYVNSTLSKISDVTLLSSTYDLEYYTDAMVSRLIQLVIFDMIYISVNLKLGEASKESIELSRSAISVAKKNIMKLKK